MDISRAEQRILHLLAQGGRIDIVRDDPNLELKIITFSPDVIFLLRKDTTDQAREQAIARMANGTTPVHAFSIDHTIDLDLFLAE